MKSGQEIFFLINWGIVRSNPLTKWEIITKHKQFSSVITKKIFHYENQTKVYRKLYSCKWYDLKFWKKKKRLRWTKDITSEVRKRKKNTPNESRGVGINKDGSLYWFTRKQRESGNETRSWYLKRLMD